MSQKAQETVITDGKLCALCRQHPARFRYRGKVKRDADHDICFQCYRRVVNQNRDKSEPLHQEDVSRMSDLQLIKYGLNWSDKSTLQRDCFALALTVLAAIACVLFLFLWDTQ